MENSLSKSTWICVMCTEKVMELSLTVSHNRWGTQPVPSLHIWKVNNVNVTKEKDKGYHKVLIMVRSFPWSPMGTNRYLRTALRGPAI